MNIVVLIHWKDKFQPTPFVLHVSNPNPGANLPSALATMILEHAVDLTEVARIEIFP